MEAADQPCDQTQTQTLGCTIDDDLLKAIPIQVVLSSCGHSFKTSRDKRQEFMKAFTVTSISDFLSHDWSTGRFSKTISLCLIYNGVPASVSAFVCGMFLFLFQSKALLGCLHFERAHNPDAVGADMLIKQGSLALILCPFVFLFVFFTWQDIRTFLRLGSRNVFLDKLCIDQRDRKKKVKGIFGLAGFLEKSDRLVVLWSPSYFTRLWCTYEVASWLHLEKELETVLFMPVATGLTVMSLFAMSQFISLAYHFGSPVFPNAEICVVFIFLLACPFCAHTFRHLAHNLRSLPDQISNFSIANAGCFCCAVNHCMPGSDARLPCDRAIIYNTLKGWFREDDSGRQDSPFGESSSFALFTATSSAMGRLERFDDKMRSLFGKFVLERAGPTRISYLHIIIGTQPVLWRTLDCLVSPDIWADPVWLRRQFSALPLIAAVVPLTMKSQFFLAVLVDSAIGIPARRSLDYLVSIVSGLVLAITLFVQWWLLFKAAIWGWIHLFAATALLGIVVCVVFRRELLLSLGPRRSTPTRGDSIQIKVVNDSEVDAIEAGRDDRLTTIHSETDVDVENEQIAYDMLGGTVMKGVPVLNL